MKVQKGSYKGKKVFVGMDVHKKSYVIVAICDGQVVKKWTASSSPEKLSEQLCKYFEGADIRSAYEAGCTGFRLHRVLVETGISNIVVNAASIEVDSNNKVKTDKRDAKKIAFKLSTGELRPIYIPTVEEEKKRSLTRGREQTVRRRQRIGNQIKMKLLYLGVEGIDDKQMSVGYLKQVDKLDLEAEHKFVIDELIEAWRQETDRIKRFNKELEKQACQDVNEKIGQSLLLEKLMLRRSSGHDFVEKGSLWRPFFNKIWLRLR